MDPHRRFSSTIPRLASVAVWPAVPAVAVVLIVGKASPKLLEVVVRPVTFADRPEFVGSEVFAVDDLHVVRSGEPNVDPTRTLDPNSKIDSVVALASEAIRYVDQKKN